MPEFAFGVDPWRKGTSSNPFPPDSPHGLMDTPVTLTNPSQTDSVVTDYGVIPPGGSLQIPGLTDFDLSLISAGKLTSNVTQPFPGMAPVFGVVIVEVTNNDASGITPFMTATIAANGYVGPNRPIGLVPVVGQANRFNGQLPFPTFLQNAPSGVFCTFSFSMAAQGGTPDSSTSTFDIAILMALGVADFELADNDQFQWSYYPVVQDLSTGIWVLQQPPVLVGPTQFPPQLLYPNASGQGVTVTIYGSSSTDPSNPIGATATLVLEWE